MGRRRDASNDDERYHVYMLIGPSGHPIYIGKSTQLDTRLKQHSRDRIRYAAIGRRTRWEVTHHVEVFECDSYDDMTQAEEQLIQEHKPVLNKRSNPNWDKRRNTVVTVLNWDNARVLPGQQFDLPIRQLVC